MNKLTKPIEEFFLESLLKVCLAGILLILLIDIYVTGKPMSQSVIVDLLILSSTLAALLLYKAGRFTASVLVIGLVNLITMFYQGIQADTITTSSMAVIIVIGFGFSVLLKGTLPLLLHVVTIGGMASIFIWQALHPLRYGKPHAGDIIITGVTYIICLLYTSPSPRD